MLRGTRPSWHGADDGPGLASPHDAGLASGHAGPAPRPGRSGGRRSAARATQRSHRLRVALWRWRFAWCAAVLGVAAAVVVAELRPPPAPTTPVVVAARELPAGAVLEADDVRVAQVDPGMVPAGTPREVIDVLGQRLAAAVPAGLPLVTTLLTEPGWAAGAPPGTVVAPVRLADPAVAAMLRPGDVVDVLAAGGSGTGGPADARLVAHRAVVLDTPTTEDSGGGLLGLGDDGAGDPITALAVRPSEAAALAGTLGWGSLTAVLVE